MKWSGDRCVGRRRWLLVLALVLPSLCAAHTGSNSFLNLDLVDERWMGRWDIAVADLELAVGLDSDADGRVTWGELKAAEAALAGYVFARLDLGSGAWACRPVPDGLRVSQRAAGAFAAFTFDAGCPADAPPPAIRYRLLFDQDDDHRAFVSVNAQGRGTSAVLSPSEPRFDAALSLDDTAVNQILRYLSQGVHHVLIGADHVLFLVVLLLPSVLRRDGGRWQGIGDPRRAMLGVLGLVTAFTCAHAITITLAALDLVALPVAPVEAAIALTVLVAALNNVWPVMQRGLVAGAFAVGLVHGLGFANALAELGLPAQGQLWSLLGFNLGVELGQMMIVGLVFPLAFWLRHSLLYHRVAVAGGSAAIALVAGYWLVERLSVVARSVV